MTNIILIPESGVRNQEFRNDKESLPGINITIICVVWYASACLYKNIAKEQAVSIKAMYIKLIFCVRKRRFSTIDFNNLTSYVSVYYC